MKEFVCREEISGFYFVWISVTETYTSPVSHKVGGDSVVLSSLKLISMDGLSNRTTRHRHRGPKRSESLRVHVYGNISCSRVIELSEKMLKYSNNEPQRDTNELHRELNNSKLLQRHNYEDTTNKISVVVLCLKPKNKPTFALWQSLSSNRTR